VLVDFWASWCVPCRASFPWMSELHRRYAPDGLVIVAVDLDRDRALADRFLELHPAPFTVAFDPAGRTAEAYGVKGMPSSFLVARDGTILHSHAGFDTRKAAMVEDLVRESLRP
jgi:cytochrome c biogenesis protein CcmG/thiol:disulfide interchange protein DsbE